MNIERLASHCTVDGNGCWLWTRSVNNKGYAITRVGSPLRTQLVHRVTYESVNGAIPAHLQIDHLCSVRRCVNPDHLEAVTPRCNVLRARSSVPAINAAKTHCPREHEYTPANTYVTPRNQRVCRECIQIRKAARKAAA